MKNKILLTVLILSTLFTSCQKEYSQLNKENEIELTITGVKYVTTVNGSTGNYWKVTLQSNKALSVDYIVSYEFYDGSTRMTLNHTINANSTANIAFTQYTATANNISKVKVLGVDGANLYRFILK